MRDREHHTAYCAEWRRMHPEASKAYTRRYYERHRQEIADRNRQRRLEDPEGYIRKAREYRAAHREQVRATNRRCREKAREREHRRPSLVAEHMRWQQAERDAHAWDQVRNMEARKT